MYVWRHSVSCVYIFFFLSFFIFSLFNFHLSYILSVCSHIFRKEITDSLQSLTKIFLEKLLERELRDTIVIKIYIEYIIDYRIYIRYIITVNNTVNCIPARTKKIVFFFLASREVRLNVCLYSSRCVLLIYLIYN